MTVEESSDIRTLRRRNDAIRVELGRLRAFIDSLQGLLDALDHPRSDDAIMAALSTTLKRALEAIDASNSALLVLDEDAGDLVVVITHGEIPRDRMAWKRMPPDTGIPGWVLRHGQPLIVNDVRADERFSPDLDRETGFTTESVLSVPVIGRGKVLGVFEILNKRSRSLFVTEDQTLISLMSRFAGELLYRMGGDQKAPSSA